MAGKKRGPGRPKAKIDWGIVDRMLEADCEGTEVAAYLGIDPETLYRRCQAEKNVGFSEYLRQKKARGDVQLKVKQHAAALKGDKTMMVWMGKQRLGQRDKVEQQNRYDLDPEDEIDLDQLTDDELAELEAAEAVRERLRAKSGKKPD